MTTVTSDELDNEITHKSHQWATAASKIEILRRVRSTVLDEGGDDAEDVVREIDRRLSRYRSLAAEFRVDIELAKHVRTTGGTGAVTVNEPKTPSSASAPDGTGADDGHQADGVGTD